MDEVTKFIKEIGFGKILAVGAILLTIIVAIYALTSQLGNQNLSPLFSELELKDAAEIAKELDSRDIPYEIRANGTQIAVPDSQVLKLRLDMAGLGIPNRGSVVGYEVFDKGESLGTSNFIQNVNLLRALEGELSRTITEFNEIDSARVHLVIPKRELFKRDKQEPTASIALRMRGGKVLSKQQINAIAHLVSTAVPGLSVAKVTIVDNMGRTLKLGGNTEQDAFNGGNQNSEDFRFSLENRMTNMIEDLLSRSIGDGKVKAQVTAEINFDRIVTNSEIYDPDGQVVRSVQTRDEKESSFDKSEQDSSIEQNLPDSGSSKSAPGAGSNIQKLDEVTNYEISKKIVNHISETGTIKKISIAVLVDGMYKKGETGAFEYVPRTEEEVKKIESLVKSAVGFDEARNDKVEIINMQFITDMDLLREESTAEWFKRELPSLVQSVVIGIVVIMVLLFLVRPIAIRAFEMNKFEDEEPDESEEEIREQVNQTLKVQAEKDLQLGANDNQEIDVDLMGKKFKSGSLKTINDFASKYPDETVSIIRGWLNKE